MKAWEVLKLLQEGKKIRLKEWEDDLYAELYVDNESYIKIKTNDGEIYDISELLKENEEWEEYIKIGDWVTHLNNGNIFKVEYVGEHSVFGDDGYKYGYAFSEIRKATNQEIKQELERRKWRKLGRNINEYKKGDIVYVSYSADIPAGFYEVVSVNPMYLKNETTGGYNEEHHNFGSIKLICPVEYRVDLEIE